MDNSQSKILINGRTRNEEFFLSVLLAYLLFSTIDNNTLLGEFEIVAWICDIAKIGALLTLAIHAMAHIRTYSKKQILCFAIFGVMATICFITNRLIGPIVFLLFWVNIKDIEFKGILLVYLIAIGFVCCITLICTVLQIIPDRIFDGFRHAFGFVHANTVGAMSMTLIMCYTAYRYNQIRWYELLICLALSITVFAFCRSKGAFACSLVTIALSMIIKMGFSTTGEGIMAITGTCICPVCAIIVFALSLFYNPESKFFTMVNHILTGRPALGNKAITNYGVRLFGQKILWTTEVGKYNIVDSSYLGIIFDYGLILFAVFISLYVILGYRAGKNKRWDIILILIVISLHAVVEGTLTEAANNPAIIAVGCILYNEEKIRIKKRVKCK